MNKIDKCNKDHKDAVCVYNSPIKYFSKCYYCNNYSNYESMRYENHIPDNNSINIDQSDEVVSKEAWQVFIGTFNKN